MVGGCGAQPNADDVRRVKQHFLSLRFSAPLRPQMRDLSDQTLFRTSCEQMRVDCDQVLAKLKKSDPDFFATLQKDKAAR